MKVISWFRSQSRLLQIGVVLAAIIVVVIAVSAITGSSNGEAGGNVTAAQLDASITSAQLQKSPTKYKGKVVEVSGKVFNVDTGDGNTAVQIYTDPENSDGNIALTGSMTNGLKENDYVKIIGQVTGVFEGDNAFGATLNIPQIAVIKLTKSDRNEVVAPAIKTKQAEKTITKDGVSVTLKSAEFAKDETRINVNVKNANTETINFYSFNTKLVQDGSQIKDKSIYEDSGKYEIPSDIVGHTSESGILFFQKADPSLPLKVHFEATTTTNYDTLNFDFNI
jgi:hypothetical protein